MRACVWGGGGGRAGEGGHWHILDPHMSSFAENWTALRMVVASDCGVWLLTS